MADFSYFDQFDSMQVDLTQYLLNLSASTSGSYSYTLSNTQPIVTTISNLFTMESFVVNYKNNLDQIVFYTVSGDEFMDTVAYKAWGSVDYWWIIAIFNDITEPFKQWPLTQAEVVTMATNLYNKNPIYTYQTYHDLINEENDSRRSIILPQTQTVIDLIWDYRQAILAQG